MQHHALRILQPEFAGADVADGEAVAALDVLALELADVGQIVDLAGGGDLGDAEAADAQAADGELVALASELQGAAAEIAAADPGELNLLNAHRAGFLEIVGRIRRPGGRAGDRGDHDERQSMPLQPHDAFLPCILMPAYAQPFTLGVRLPRRRPQAMIARSRRAEATRSPSATARLPRRVPTYARCPRARAI